MLPRSLQHVSLWLFLLSHNALGYRVNDPLRLNSHTASIILTSFKHGIMGIHASHIGGFDEEGSLWVRDSTGWVFDG